MKPKQNAKGNTAVSSGYDRCYTPPYALTPLLPYLPKDMTIWEPAAGAGHLVEALKDNGYRVARSEVQDGQNFFLFEPPCAWGAVVTNPPYSIKPEWIRRCYALGKPFALLVPVETIGTGEVLAMAAEHGMELLLLNRRVNFCMPEKGWAGSSAQFPVLWLCWRLLPAPIVYGDIPKGAHRRFVDSLSQQMMNLEAA